MVRLTVRGVGGVGPLGPDSGSKFSHAYKEGLTTVFWAKSFFFPPTPKNSLKADRKEVGGQPLRMSLTVK